MLKTRALDQLRHKRNAFIYVCASMHLLNSDSVNKLKDVLVLFNKKGIVFNPHDSERINGRMEIDLTEIIHTKKSDLLVDIEELYKFTRRNLIKESFEVVKEYAKSNNCYDDLKKESWYWFAKVIRDTVSHSLYYKLDSKELKKVLPIRWEGKEIDFTMNGQEMKQDIVDPLTTLRLIEAIDEFINTH